MTYMIIAFCILWVLGAVESYENTLMSEWFEEDKKEIGHIMTDRQIEVVAFLCCLITWPFDTFRSVIRGNE